MENKELVESLHYKMVEKTRVPHANIVVGVPLFGGKKVDMMLVGQNPSFQFWLGTDEEGKLYKGETALSPDMGFLYTDEMFLRGYLAGVTNQVTGPGYIGKV